MCYFNEFLADNAPRVAADVVAAYARTMGRTLHSVFRSYRSELDKLALRIADTRATVAGPSRTGGAGASASAAVAGMFGGLGSLFGGGGGGGSAAADAARARAKVKAKEQAAAAAAAAAAAGQHGGGGGGGGGGKYRGVVSAVHKGGILSLGTRHCVASSASLLSG